MDNNLHVQVEVKHFGYGFTVTPNGNIQMRIPVKQLKDGDILIKYSPCDETVIVERQLENVEVIAKKIIA